jgi:DNA replication initiation complex subunit (GINS family)
MAAVKVKATGLCFFESELKQPGSVFWLTDIKDEKGKVIVPAEKQFAGKFMERVTDTAVRAKGGKNADEAQRTADERARLDLEAKEMTKGASQKVTEPPASELTKPTESPL